MYAHFYFLSTGEDATESQINSGLKEFQRMHEEEPDRLEQIETVYSWAFRDAVSEGGRVLDDRGLRRLRNCESTDNYSISTGNGYYGAYQFSVATWNNVAERHLPYLVGVRPDQASRLEQDAMTKILWSMDGGGPGHWPVCSRKV